MGMSGRELFTFNPEMYEDEDDVAGGEDWDLAAYRKTRQDEDDLAEKERLDAFNEQFAQMQADADAGLLDEEDEDEEGDGEGEEDEDEDEGAEEGEQEAEEQDQETLVEGKGKGKGKEAADHPATESNGVNGD